MDVFRGYQTLSRALRTPTIAIGNFDGVHLGHLQVLRAAFEEARAFQPPGEVVVLTFDPHPAKVLAPELAPPLISTLPERLAALERAGVDAAVLQPFDRAFAQKTPEEFVEEVLAKGLGARRVVVGYDFTFGKKRAGNFEVLRQLCEERRINARRVEAFQLDGITVSSTKIREFVLEGRVKGARLLLGRPFSLSGEVVRGKARGRTIGFPTANLAVEEELLPKEGVYACRAVVLGEGAAYDAVTNVGVAPTFGAGAVTVEAHLLDLDRDLYGRRLRLEFLDRLRPEQRFGGVDELKAQIARDVEAARELLAREPA